MSSVDQPAPESHFRRAGKYALTTLGGFQTFILRGNVVDLAIGIVIGAAFTSVVNGLVADVITPLIPVPGGSLSGWTWNVPYAKGAVVHFGTFINAIISFLIVALVLYFFVVKPVGALLARYKSHETPAPTTRDCPYCLQAIPLAATRCAFCTSVLTTAASMPGNSERPPV